MIQHELALQATRQALDAFDAPGTSLAALVRLTQRVASLRNDVLGSAVIALESVDLLMPKEGRKLFPEQVQELQALLPQGEAAQLLTDAHERRIARMTIPGDSQSGPMVWGGSAASLETSVHELEQKIAAVDRHSALVASRSPRIVEENEDLRVKLEKTASERRTLIERTKTFLFEYLLAAEAELLRGQSYSTSFERTIRYVDTELQVISPTASAELIAAHTRIREATPESLAQAMLSCRRALKSIADSVYPAPDQTVRGLDGAMRALTEDQFVNRLLQYVIERTGVQTHHEVVQSGLDALGRRLQSVHALDSKGVHSAVTPNEADAALSQTYLLAAEIFRIRDESEREGPAAA